MKRRPLKVLHVVWSLEPGGMENGLVNLARLLPPGDFEIHVCCLERGGAFVERFPFSANIHIMCKREGFSPRSLWGLMKLIHALRPDVIHSHNLGTLMYASMATGHGRAVPILHGEHGQLTGEYARARRVGQRRKYWRHCRLIHTVSPSLKQHFVDFGFPDDAIRVINNGVDSERFAPGAKGAGKAGLGLPENAVVIGMLGRFGEWKRHDAVLEAFELAAPDHPDWHLLFVGGGGPNEAAIQSRVAASRFGDRVRLAGFQQDPRRFYHAMDLLAIASINEGLPNALLEAMASGVPGLGNSAACGLEEVISRGHDGFIADLGSPAKIAAALAECLADPGRLVDMGRAARETVIRRFSLESMVREYQRIYREAAGVSMN